MKPTNIKLKLDMSRMSQKAISKILNSESTEVVSDAMRESGVLHDVTESNVERSSANGSKASVEGALQKIIHSKEVCPNCNSTNIYECVNTTHYGCMVCHYDWAKLVE